MEKDTHIFKGLKRDIHPAYQPTEFLWGAHNVRITNREDNSMFAVTNEKGNTPIIYMDGKILGYHIIGEYLIVFTKSNYDCIYRLFLNDDVDNIEVKLLYKGNLDFDVKNPITAVSDYESELIQKVYWIDGKNPPRVINIKHPESVKASYNNTTGYTSAYSNLAPFNFSKDLNLRETVKVTRIDSGSGLFHSGVIQYAFTYYNKYGQESNIVYNTELNYISYADRGASPEEIVNCTFQIKIDNIQKDFDYIRLYSILRTSLNGTPEVKIVSDVKIPDDGNSITIVDNGNIGEIIDASRLLFVGSKDIIPQCIEAKDNVLFLGNLTYKNNSASEILKTISIDTPTTTIKRVPIGKGTNINGIEFSNQLKQNTSGYKIKEYYRLGIQVQYKNGEWSEPKYVDDYRIAPGNNHENNPKIDNGYLNIPCPQITLDQSTTNKLIDAGYKRARALVVFPNRTERTVALQGIVNPTVFNFVDRMVNRPFAMSSWIFRPMTLSRTTYRNGVANSVGQLASWQHLSHLLSGNGAEMQTSNLLYYIPGDSGYGTLETFGNQTGRATTEESELRNLGNMWKNYTNKFDHKSDFYVDQSIFTLHSPDIEFDEDLQNLIAGGGFNYRIVGMTIFNRTKGNMTLSTSTPTVEGKRSGCVGASIDTDYGYRALLSAPAFEDNRVQKNGDRYESVGGDAPHRWIVHMWQCAGSLNNDVVRSDGSTRTAVLQTKCTSNLRYSEENIWFNDTPFIDVDNTQVFNSNEVSIVSLQDAHTKLPNNIYYGNVDTIVNTITPICIYHIPDNMKKGNKDIDIKYILEESITSNNFGSYSLIDERISIDNVYDCTTASSQGPISYSRFILATGKDNKTFFIYLSAYTPNSDYWDILLPSGEYYASYASEVNWNGTNVYIKNCSGSVLINGKYKNFFGIIKSDDAISSPDFGTTVPVQDNQYPGVALAPDRFTMNDDILWKKKDDLRLKFKSTPHIVGTCSYKRASTSSKYSRGNLPYPAFNENIPNYIKENVYVKSQPWLSYNDESENGTSVELNQIDIPKENINDKGFLWLVELYRNKPDTMFGGTSEEALRANLWTPASLPVNLTRNVRTEIKCTIGDTWYQRYECLKTYPFTFEDENQVIEIGSFLCETHVNIDGRYDRNRSNITNDKLSPTNFNLINPVYSQIDNYFNYRITDSDYTNSNQFTNQIIWSEPKVRLGTTDTWTNIHASNSLDLDATCGDINSIKSFNEYLIGFQDRGVQHILFNSRVQIQATDGVPIEIANSQRVEGYRTISNIIGCQDNSAIVTTPSGIYFTDYNTKSAYMFNGKLENIGERLGALYWFRDNITKYKWNPDITDDCIKLGYDSKYRDVYFIKCSSKNNTEALCFSESLAQFTSTLSYGNTSMFSVGDSFYALRNSPTQAILWKNFSSDEYNMLFDNKVSSYIEFISAANSSQNKIFDTVEFNATVGKNSDISSEDNSHRATNYPIESIEVKTDYQHGESVTDDSVMQRKFRTWRIKIPRDNVNENHRDRICNNWANIKLKFADGSNYREQHPKIVLQNTAVNYTI